MKQKVTVSIDERLLQQLDAFRFESRSAAMEAAIVALQRWQLDAEFERNLALLDPAEERQEAERGLSDYVEHVLGEA